MANTYTQIFIHVIFAVKGRASLIPRGKGEELCRFITGIVQNRKHKMLSVYCMRDHVHVLVGLHPAQSLSSLVQDIKTASTHFINKQKWIRGQFNWQAGYGAFSYSKSQVDKVVKYILGQEQHHRKSTFKEEYISFLKSFGIEYDERYVFQADELSANENE